MSTMHLEYLKIKNTAFLALVLGACSPVHPRSESSPPIDSHMIENEVHQFFSRYYIISVSYHGNIGRERDQGLIRTDSLLRRTKFYENSMVEASCAPIKRMVHYNINAEGEIARQSWACLIDSRQIGDKTVSATLDDKACLPEQPLYMSRSLGSAMIEFVCDLN